MRTILLYILLTFLPLAAFAQEVGEARFMRPLRHFQREVYEQRLPSARIDNLINYCMDNKQYDKLVRELPPLCDSILYFYHDTTAFLYSQPYLCSAFDRIGDVLGYEPYKNKMIPLLKGASDDVTNGFITLGSFYGKKHQPDSVAYFLKRAVHSYSLSHCAETDIYLAMQLMAAGMLHTRGEYTEAIHIASECATKYKTSTNDERNIRLADAYYIMAKSYLAALL